MYLVYFEDIQLPVAPGKIQRKVGNKNKSLSLINGGEITIPKSPKLSELDFSCMLPVKKYPFAQYPDGEFHPPSYYSGHFEALKKRREAFSFRILRYLNQDGNISADMDFNMRVTLEEYAITEDSSNHPDMEASIKLKEYRDYGTKIITITKDEDGDNNAIDEVQRPSEKEPVNNYTVKSGDSFWGIAQKELGDGSRWTEIVALNKDGALRGRENGMAAYGGYTIHPGDVLILPRQ